MLFAQQWWTTATSVPARAWVFHPEASRRFRRQYNFADRCSLEPAPKLQPERRHSAALGSVGQSPASPAGPALCWVLRAARSCFRRQSSEEELGGGGLCDFRYVHIYKPAVNQDPKTIHVYSIIYIYICILFIYDHLCLFIHVCMTRSSFRLLFFVAVVEKHAQSEFLPARKVM